MFTTKMIAVIVALFLTAGTALTVITVVIVGTWYGATGQAAATTVTPEGTPDESATPDTSAPVETGTITGTATITGTTSPTVTVTGTPTPIMDIITVIVGVGDDHDGHSATIDLNIVLGLVPGFDSGGHHGDDDDDDDNGPGSGHHHGDGDHDRGHGNDRDGHDEDNPGNSRH